MDFPFKTLLRETITLFPLLSGLFKKNSYLSEEGKGYGSSPPAAPRVTLSTPKVIVPLTITIFWSPVFTTVLTDPLSTVGLT